ncbi:MAG: hypothetical protein QM800_06570 [Paludibacter sp.]
MARPLLIMKQPASSSPLLRIALSSLLLSFGAWHVQAQQNPSGPEAGQPPMAPGAGGPSMGGPGGGPGGPGALGAEGGDSAAAEPLVTRAERLADIARSQHRDAVTLVLDLEVMDSCRLEGADAFCPDRSLTRVELARALARASTLVRGAQPRDAVQFVVAQGWLNKSGSASSVSGYEAARAWLGALGIKNVLKESQSAVDVAIKRYNLSRNLESLDFSQPLTRDSAAQLIANALQASDGSARIPVVKHKSPVKLPSGKLVIDNTRLFNFGATVIDNAGTSELVVRNSRIDGDSSVKTKSLSGPPAGLLIGGSIRTTLALNQSQAFYLNSTINSKDWAALSTDGAEPVTQAGQKELSVYTYGSTARTFDGGYAVYSDLFCNIYMYGSIMQAAETAVISGTYGKVVIGTIADGEAQADLAAQLSAADRQQQTNKQLGSTIIGGRTALMIHSVNLPPYWNFKGYSQQELPLYAAPVSVHGGTLATDLSLDKQAEYTPERQAYIRHVAGSVILIRSSNANVALDGVQLQAGKGGTGAVIHTVINNDTNFMIKVPDGETYSGSNITMKAMRVQGNVLNEDYQRDMSLVLQGSSLSGRIVSGTVADWNSAARAGGFPAFIIDANGYRTAHGVKLTLETGSSWTVTGNSILAALTINDASQLKAPRGKTLVLKVNGFRTAIRAGHYAGNIEVTIS